MTTGETLYLALVLGTFAAFSATLAYMTWAYDKTKAEASATEAKGQPVHV